MRGGTTLRLRRAVWIVVLAAVCVVAFQERAEAYIGPGAGFAVGTTLVAFFVAMFSGFVAIFLWLFRRARFPKTFKGQTIQMDDGKRFTIFRHAHRKNQCANPAVLVVRFRFEKYSEKTNRRLSKIPIPLIVGFPGFCDKVWMSCEDGYWQGVYQWESPAAVDSYKRSFVLSIMNRRAAKNTVTMTTIPGKTVHDYILERTS